MDYQEKNPYSVGILNMIMASIYISSPNTKIFLEKYLRLTPWNKFHGSKIKMLIFQKNVKYLNIFRLSKNDTESKT